MAFDSKQPSGPGAQTANCLPAPNSQIRRTFCRWGTDGANTAVNPTPMSVRGAIQNQDNTLRMASGSSSEPCWWVASCNAREVIRRQANVDGVTRALLPSQINDTGLLTSKLWCRVGWHKEGTGNVVLFDIAGNMRIAINACNVEMDLVTPLDCFSVRGNQTISKSFTGTGTFLDTTIRSSLVQGYASLQSTALLTQTFVVAGGGTVIQVPMPPGAIAVDVYVPGGVAAGLAEPGFWAELVDPLGTAVGGGIIGFIPFSGISADRSGRVPRPGNAAGIISTNTTAGALVFTYVWYLEF